MRFAALIVAVAGLTAAAASASAVQPELDTGLEVRGEIHDIMRTIRREKCGLDFCSTFIHLPPPKTCTKTITKTVFGATVPSSTKVQTSVLTRTASAVTRTSTAVVTVKVTPTVSATVQVPVPSTSVVTTITSVVTATQEVTQTVTSFTPPARRRTSRKGDRIPSWLHGYCADSISKACSHLVTRSTTTKTKTVTSTRTRTTGVSTINKTSVRTLTPTSIAVVTVSATATVSPAITSVETVTSSSLVTISATDFSTTTVTVTASTPVTVTLPSPVSPTLTGRIKATNADDGSFLGYLGPVRNGFGTTTSVSDAASAILVTFESVAAAVGPVNLRLVPAASRPFLGAVFGQNGNNADLKANSGNRYLNMGQVNQVAAGTQSGSNSGSTLNDNGLGGAYESQIWNYNPATNGLTITWTNTDGAAVVNPSLVLIDIGLAFFEWTLDTDTFESSYSGTEVNLSFEVAN
ncbi:hypothetical protein V8E36_000015 [Tilletia maclaganii]